MFMNEIVLSEKQSSAIAPPTGVESKQQNSSTPLAGNKTISSGSVAAPKFRLLKGESRLQAHPFRPSAPLNKPSPHRTHHSGGIVKKISNGSQAINEVHTKDWTGSLLILLTWGLLLFANYVSVTRIFIVWFGRPSRFYTTYATAGLSGFLRKLLTPNLTIVGFCLFVPYELLNFAASIAHIRAVFSDPGSTALYVPAAPPDDFTSPRFCRPCGKRWKPPRAHHCRKCRKCVYRMDHHCAWIDNCVGLMNQKYFILFLLYGGVLCGYQIALILISVACWAVGGASEATLGSVFLGLLLLCAASTFVYMTSDFLSEQLEALETNSTLVESHQHTHGPKKEFWTRVSEVFGSDWWLWWLPTQPRLDPDYAEPVYLDEAVAAQIRIRRSKESAHSPALRRRGSKRGREPEITIDKRENIKTQYGEGLAELSDGNETEMGFQSSGCIYDQAIATRDFGHGYQQQQCRARGNQSSRKSERSPRGKGRKGSEVSSDSGGGPVRPEALGQISSDQMSFSSGSYDRQTFRNVFIRPTADIGIDYDRDDSDPYLEYYYNDDNNNSVGRMTRNYDSTDTHNNNSAGNSSNAQYIERSDSEDELSEDEHFEINERCDSSGGGSQLDEFDGLHDAGHISKHALGGSSSDG